MPVSREELQRRVTKLEADMPGLMAQYPDAEHFNTACSKGTDDITDAAGVEDEVWAFEQIDRILEKHGLWRPNQNNLPPELRRGYAHKP